ncbi:MAG: xanthine dehydrogenase family protein molybdopterin-binding subunit [Smithellaceae bacterium]|nr:xanthine dehydrogenase family protein molybdopterin-binding subunit [Smithellaceae bacterium]
MNNILNLSRRQFLKAGAAIGGGMILGFYVPLGERKAGAAGAAKFTPNAFLRIDAEGKVIVIVPQSDMGQGVLTSFPMIVADELDTEWKNVQFEQSPAAKVYYNPIIGMQLTGGSTSVRSFWKPLREAGATARTMLVSAAAATWNVGSDACRTESGAVIHPASGRRLAYGDLVQKAAEMPVPKKVKLKDPEEFEIIGKGADRLDTPLKVRGAGAFGLDVTVPNALVAVVSRCPVFGGKLAGYDDREAKAVPEVRGVVPIASGVAVVGDTFWAAKAGRDRLKVKWDEGSLARLSSEDIRRAFKKASQRTGPTARNDGDALGIFKRSKRKIEAVYEVPYLAHANMEPMNCTASVLKDKCEIWAPTQGQTIAQRVAAKITGLPQDTIAIHTTFLGTGFGRRAEADFLAEAVEISKAVGRPVKVVWTREDDMHHDHYRPAIYSRMTAALDDQGMPVAWMHRIVGPSIFGAHAQMFGTAPPIIDPSAVEGAADIIYGIPNLRVEYIENEPGIPVGFWRSVGHSQNTFFVESFLDEIAHAGKKDPYELRRALLTKQPRLLGVLDKAASEAGWDKPLQKGRFRGIAALQAYGSHVAQVVEISLPAGDALRVHRVVCAVDCGQSVNPLTIEAQVEGGIVFGLTAALKDEITIARGRVKQSNFNDYPMLRMNEMPAVEVHIIESREAPGGIGEVAVGTVAPALAGAIFSATGQRIRELPIRLNKA